MCADKGPIIPTTILIEEGRREGDSSSHDDDFNDSLEIEDVDCINCCYWPEIGRLKG